MASRSLTSCAALLAIATGSHLAQAQPVSSAQAEPIRFTCPKAGTIEERGAFKSQFTGASPSDPNICTSTDSWNKPQALLFNFYRPEEVEGTNVRAGLMDLFAGHKTTVDLTTAAGSKETWKILRREQVTVGGKTIDTVVFEQDRERFASSRHPFHGVYTRWFDPKDGLWVKADLNVISGEVAMERKSFRDTAITLP